MLEKCRERKKEIENEFYKKIACSNNIPELEKLSDEMINMELLVIRMEKQEFERMYNTEYAI